VPQDAEFFFKIKIFEEYAKATEGLNSVSTDAPQTLDR